jgi:signal transduction histidine kinase
MGNDLLALIFASTVDIFIGLLVIYRNYRQPANRAFALTSFSLVCWAGLNFLSTYLPPNYTLAVTRFTGFFGALLISSFFILSRVFPSVLETSRNTKRALIVITAVICALSLTALFIKSGVKTSAGLQLSEGALYPIYPLYILGMFILCNLNFVRQYRQANRLAKRQIILMWLGIFITVALIILSNVILPAITSSWTSSHFGTIFTIPFVAITAYAILTRRMFDVRLVITRTIAYLLTIAIVAGFYSLIVILLATQLASLGQLNNAELLTLVLPALFIALTFHRIRLAVDSLTKRVFYRDAYDVRNVLDGLSDALLTEKDIDRIMQQTVALLAEVIRPKVVYLAVLNDSGKVYKDLQSGDQTISAAPDFLAHMEKEAEALIDINEYSGSNVTRLMRQNNIEVLLRLGNQATPVGLLLLGEKRNGSLYNDQDLLVLRIGAKNLGIALENAKKYEQIAQFADTMHKEVLKATSSLRQANAELKTLDALKDDFISMASHQLRSPATSVHQATQMLNSTDLTPAERRRLLQLAEASSERLVGVITNMLSMARIQAGHFVLDKTKVDLVELVERARLETSALARQEEVKVNFAKPKQALNITADRAKLNESMSNFLENAIKYSPAGSTVKVELKKQDGQIHFEVIDNGIGVPADERKNLFSKFYRADNARKAEPNGNGIGLFVVKTIVEAHGGEAYYKPLQPGSLFGFWLPV